MSLGISRTCRRRRTHRGKRGGRDRFKEHLKFGTVNSRSLRNKSTIFQDFVVDHKLDFVCVCETWLTSDDDAVVADLCPTSYIFKHCPRVAGRGGGMTFLHKDSLQVIIKSPENYDSFECMSATISNDSNCMDISVIYRPPGGHSFSKFLEDFSDFLDGRMYRTPPFHRTHKSLMIFLTIMPSPS